MRIQKQEIQLTVINQHRLMFRKKIFSSLCNQEIVDLEPVTGADVELVRGLVREHRQLTGSPVAERLLEDWDSSVKMFVKVWLDYEQVKILLSS